MSARSWPLKMYRNRYLMDLMEAQISTLMWASYFKQRALL